MKRGDGMQKSEGRTAKNNWRIPVIGAAILVVAVALVLGGIFLPEAKQKSRMKKTLNAFLDADAVYVLVTDPQYDTGDLLGNDGREVRLEESRISAVREAVRAVLDAGLSFAEAKETPAGSFDTRVLLRDTAGGTVQFFVTGSYVGFTDGGGYFLFTAKKGDSVEALSRLLSGYLTEN